MIFRQATKPSLLYCTTLIQFGLWQEAEALQKDVNLLQAETGQLRRDLELKCEMEVQYAQRGVLQVSPWFLHYL